jgi:uncharacterized zinc-type alcohol dehydrogenase-like protein
MAKAAPLMCAGATTYSPLKRWGAGPGMRVGVIGLGGLGHIAIQIAAAMGAEVSVISRTLSKKDDGLALGASDYWATSDEATFKTLFASFDFLLCTVSSVQNMGDYINCLRPGGVLVGVGLPPDPISFPMNALSRHKSISGSLIAGRKETQEMLDFCGAHGVEARIELIRATDIDDTYKRVVASEVRYRAVLDVETIA